jgi:hypothetical protein
MKANNTIMFTPYQSQSDSLVSAAGGSVVEWNDDEQLMASKPVISPGEAVSTNSGVNQSFLV